MSAFAHWLGLVSNWLLALLVVGIPAYGYFKGVKIYEAFVEGAKEGFETALRIVPYLVAVLAAVGAFRSAGAMDALAKVLSPVTTLLGLPPEVVPLALVRPFSGSGATGILASILNDPKLGPDSFAGRLGSMVQGSTETTFYVLSVYCGAVNIINYRHALVVGLAADATGLVASVLIARLVWG